MTTDSIVDDQRLSAGREYIASLEELGFLVDTAVWTIAFDRASEKDPDLQLSIVSPLVERAGTNEIYQLLFTAYERSATPRDFDPWMVSLYGPQTHFAEMMRRQPQILHSAKLEMRDEQGVTHLIDAPLFQHVSDRMIRPGWIYKCDYHKPNIRRESFALKRFKDNLSKFAA